MKKVILRAFVPWGLLLIMAAGCTFEPPPSCGETIGGTADEALFSQNFGSMSLVNQASGLEGAPGENGAIFSEGETLAVNYESLAGATVRFCIQGISGGVIALDQTTEFQAGMGTYGLGVFPEGVYVVRVIVGDTLIKNFPFTIE